MRLEHLEVSGFKSFSERAELAFDHGVTAIVGPNGCGKSNLADAITWVLGEQSAKSLRGERMEDVIFSGSDARRPGATAEVRVRLTGLPAPPPSADVAAVDAQGPALVEFHAAEGHANRSGNGNGNGNGHGGTQHEAVAEMARIFSRDVEVTRRLYRSGESEYLIDGEVCRLRDVHELLMDTGLGAKAYAIIEQGKIGLILSSRPADRRQLIEEAAGITKYKSRRRGAELKLDAAQQNLTRVDDIVFEVEKQRGALRRQSAKARRYRRLREELRRWEKVLFARRYRELAETVDLARVRLSEAREREAAAAAHVGAVESDLSRLRLEQAEADQRASRIREEAHGRELDINRNEQQQTFDGQQAEALAVQSAQIAAEIGDLEERREPARVALEARRQATRDAALARDDADRVLTEAGSAHSGAHQRIEGLEADVEGARSEVLEAASSVAALRHAIEHGAEQSERVGESLRQLVAERVDLQLETEKVDAENVAGTESLARAQAALEQVRLDRGARESELASARAEHEEGVRALRVQEQEVAAIEARLASLEETASSRAEFGDAARMVLVEANGHVGQQGAVADYLDVDRRYERAVEACLGDLLQYVIVERHDQAAAGLSLVREQAAGRCGFVVIDPTSNGYHPPEVVRMAGVTPVSELVRVAGPHGATIQKVLPEAYVAETFEQAVALSRETSATVATLEGDVLRGPHLVAGGGKVESRGILATRREIKELGIRLASERESMARVATAAAGLEQTIAATTAAIAALQAEQHRQEKEIVGLEARLTRAAEDAVRLSRKADVIAFEQQRAEEEHVSLEAKAAEAQDSVLRFQDAQRAAEERLASAQRHLVDARENVEVHGARVAEARAAQAGLVERATALAAELERLEEGARELEQRIDSRAAELGETRTRREALLQSIAAGEQLLERAVQALDELRRQLVVADETAGDLRSKVETQDGVIREARRVLEDVRAQVGALDLARATAEGNLEHLSQACIDALQTSLDDVLAEVEQMELAGEATPDAAVIRADEPDPDLDDAEADVAAAGEPDAAVVPASDQDSGLVVAAAAAMSAEDAIVALKAKIERLGPVNMMAIEQFDELEARHVFLTTQRQDLIDSIAQTIEAITRIDKTTTARFLEAFTAIQGHFQGTFSTLFGGGRAGLTLLDENDPLESGVDIVASPPGKRLQSVQLLSGGEKALTAIALMFAIFRYKPSPFCLLDEIDAPLDDANVSRFVDMLSGMLDRTQFILITHNRRTMEIADRLYGVTMEEPGVSKLISVQLQ